MSREVVVVLKDDLDQEQIAEATHYLGYAGQWYELDLTEAHGKELNEAIQRFLESGRRVLADQVVTPPSIRRANGGRAAIALNREIAEWAKAQDPPLPHKGTGRSWMVPKETRRRFEEAHLDRKAG